MCCDIREAGNAVVMVIAVEVVIGRMKAIETTKGRFYVRVLRLI